MRFLKIYFLTIIIVLILALFLYAMSFVYVQSMQTSLGVSVPVMDMYKQESKVVFYILGKPISIDTATPESEKEYLPIEFEFMSKALKYTEETATKWYNSLPNG